MAPGVNALIKQVQHSGLLKIPQTQGRILPQDQDYFRLSELYSPILQVGVVGVSIVAVATFDQVKIHGWKYQSSVQYCGHFQK